MREVPACDHQQRSLVNPYELIRKYRCEDCRRVSMCSCDRQLGERVLPHQLGETQDYESKRQLIVDGGFTPKLCNSCRGVPEVAAPKAELYGQGSRIRRYYWREIQRDSLLAMAEWCDRNSVSNVIRATHQHEAVYASIQAEVLERTRELHETAPLYTYSEPSQTQVLEEAGVAIVEIDGTYIVGGNKDTLLLGNSGPVSVEAFVREVLSADGYQSVLLESRPLHALFAVLMRIWVQDPNDEDMRLVQFGGRPGPEVGQGGLVSTLLPPDFGSPAHARRRRSALDSHLDDLGQMGQQLVDTFDCWVSHSAELRSYLWVSDGEVVQRAREVMQIWGPGVTVSVLRFLASDYWGRYSGWPDLLVYRDQDWFLAEVKSSKDRLSSDQKTWMINNASELQLPTRLVKVIRRHESTWS